METIGLLGGTSWRLRVIESLAAGAEAVIPGCTEIGMLVRQDDTAVKLYDTTAIHAARAVQVACESEAM